MNDFEKSFHINLKHTTERIVRKWPFAHTHTHRHRNMQTSTQAYYIFDSTCTRCIYVSSIFVVPPSRTDCVRVCSWWIGCVHISRKNSIFSVALALSLSLLPYRFVLLILKANQITAIDEKLKAKNVHVCDHIGRTSEHVRNVHVKYDTFHYRHRIKSNSTRTPHSVLGESKQRRWIRRQNGAKQTKTHTLIKISISFRRFPSHSFWKFFGFFYRIFRLIHTVVARSTCSFVACSVFPKWTRWLSQSAMSLESRILSDFLLLFLLLRCNFLVTHRNLISLSVEHFHAHNVVTVFGTALPLRFSSFSWSSNFHFIPVKSTARVFLLT